jgi:hypothetical protein
VKKNESGKQEIRENIATARLTPSDLFLPSFFPDSFLFP